MLLSIVYVLLFHFISTTCWAVCFFPDGQTTDRLGIPCNETEGAFSACCRPTQGDICQPQGHCYSTTAGYWRNGCTDPTWQTPHCAKICLSDTPGGNSTWEVQMTACNTDGSFCCGKMDPQLCCTSNNKMFLPANVTQSSISTSLQNSSVSSSTPSSPPTAATSPPPKSLTKKATIGIGVGVSVFVVATAILLVFMVLVKRRRNKRRDVAESTLSATTEMEGTEKKVAEIKGTMVHEKDGSERYEVEQYASQPLELREDPRSAVELPGENIFRREEEKILK